MQDRQRRDGSPAGLLAGIALLSGLFTPLVAMAFTQENAKVALHVQPHVKKGQCVAPDAGGASPVLIPCSRFVTRGDVGVTYDLYLVVVGDEDGISGVTCGLDYDPAPLSGVDVFDWNLCSLADVSQAGPHGNWPAAGSGNRIIWDFRRCERNTVPGYEEEGVHAIAGAFYLYAYGPDVFEVSTNLAISFSEFGVTDCPVRESGLPPSARSRVVFSAGAGPDGCNPCLEPCAVDPVCTVSSTLLDFGVVPLKERVTRRLDVTNAQGEELLVGFIQLKGCDNSLSFLVYRLLQSSRYAVEPSRSASWKIEFISAIPGVHRCVLDTGPLCEDVVITAVSEGGAVAVERTTWGALKKRSWGRNERDP
jgi:hypothetical protein